MLVAILVTCVCFFLPTRPVRAADEAQAQSVRSPDTATAARRKQLDKIVLSRLAFYAGQFPDVDFVVLDSAGGVAANMEALARVIGQDPVPLDYEHPEELRRALLYATLWRVELLLGTDVGSSTLFRPGTNAAAKRESVCVVTLNPWAIARNDQAATLHFLDLPEPYLAPIPPRHHLDHVAHLRFALDHEIYHCLDSLYNGPMPMSYLEHWDDYMMRKDEAGADAFAVIMNIAEHGRRTAYARTLQNIRGLALLADDPNHDTYATVGAVLQMDPAALAKTDVRERFRLATAVRNRTVGTYADYLRYAAAAFSVMESLGIETQEGPFDSQPPNPTRVSELIIETRRSYRKLFGHDLHLPRPRKPKPPAQPNDGKQ